MKKRLDMLLVDRGLAVSRTQAVAVIMAGEVMTGTKVLDKPGVMIDEDAPLDVRTPSKYVSRAGEKLASVAGALKLEFESKTVLDVGSSTGGFTDFALQNGAVRVFAVDVGTNQLAFRLRQDARVTVMERTDIRAVESLPEPVDIVVIDVSFISLTKILEHVATLAGPDAQIVAMAKPQFEAGKEIADKFRGVIPVGEERDAILSDLRDWLSEQFEILVEADSGLAGAQGNLERFFLLEAKKQ